MSFRDESRTIRQLAAPVVATQLLSMTLGVVDNVMLGHYSTEALASSALGRVWVFGILVIAQGILVGVDPRISQGHGARDPRRIGLAVQGGIVLALLLSVPLAIATLFTGDVLAALGVDAELARLAGEYATPQIYGIPFYLLFYVQRSWLQGRGLMRPALWVVLIANVVNAIANWALIFGHLGFEAGGVAGAGYATGFTQVFVCLTLAGFMRVFHLHREAWVAWSWDVLREVRQVLRIGLPLGVQFGLEVWAFQGATLMAEHLGTAPVAGHSIVLNLASISFMVPLGISIGTATRVGNLIGAGRFERAEHAGRAAMVLGVQAMAVFALVFVVFREALPALYGAEPAVVAAAAAALPVAAAFQLFDGLQVVAGGVLRGMGRTKILAAVHLVAFYVLGLPLAYELAFRRGLGLEGLWWGLCLGLGSAAFALTAWVLRHGPRTQAPESH